MVDLRGSVKPPKLKLMLTKPRNSKHFRAEGDPLSLPTSHKGTAFVIPYLKLSLNSCIRPGTFHPCVCHGSRLDGCSHRVCYHFWAEVLRCGDSPIGREENCSFIPNETVLVIVTITTLYCERPFFKMEDS